MNEKGIGVRPIWALMSDLDMFKDCQSSNLDVSRDIRARVVNIPCSTNLSDEDIEYVCDAINSYEGNV
jgi:dTDP-4-amino-4,6-dideoxygalactose transaminase